MKRILCCLTCCLALASVSIKTSDAADAVKFKPGGMYLDAVNLPLKNPEGVACAKSAVYVADTGNERIVSYKLINDDLKDAVEIKIPQLSQPLRMKAAGDGSVLVLDGKSRKIGRIAENGNFAGMLEVRNIPQPSEIVPRGFDIDAKNNMYILDVLNERVLVVDSAGLFQRKIPFPKGYGIASDLAVDGKGAVFLLDSLKAELYKTAPDGASFQLFAKDLKTFLNFGTAMSIDSQDRIYLLDQNDSAVILLGPTGAFQGRYLSHGWKNAQLNYPTQACLTSSGLFIVADRNNNRIQLFRVQ